MRRASHNAAAPAVEDLKPGVKQNNPAFKSETAPKRAIRLLHCMGEAVSSLSVTSQQVNRWINGEHIPDGRLVQIADAVRDLFLRELLSIRDWSERYLYAQYGPRNGHASREVF